MSRLGEWDICSGCGRVVNTCRQVDGDSLCRPCRSPVMRWLWRRRWYWAIRNAHWRLVDTVRRRFEDWGAP